MGELLVELLMLTEAISHLQRPYLTQSAQAAPLLSACTLRGHTPEGDEGPRGKGRGSSHLEVVAVARGEGAVVAPAGR
jgi:hypothetical protein